MPSAPSKDDVERCKQKDLLEQMMAEMIGEFPDLHRTIVSERDIYLTYMLRQAARRLELPRSSDGDRHGRPGRGCLGAVATRPVLMRHFPHSRAQEVCPLRGGGCRGHGPRPGHREELDHGPQHPGDHDVSTARPRCAVCEHRAGPGEGAAAALGLGAGDACAPHP